MTRPYIHPPFHAGPVNNIELQESGAHWNTIREIRSRCPSGVYPFKSKREVAMAVLLWEMWGEYRKRRLGVPMVPEGEEAAKAWHEENHKLDTIIERIEDIMVMTI